MPLIDPKKRVTVGPDDNGNMFYLRAKMDIATEAAVIAEYARLSRGLGYVPDKFYRLASLKYNILAWSGPDYVDEKGIAIPCNLFNIGRLDPTDPLAAEAMKVIAEANRLPTQPPADNEDDQPVQAEVVEADAAPND